jgi:hypothetical protein
VRAEEGGGKQARIIGMAGNDLVMGPKMSTIWRSSLGPDQNIEGVHPGSFRVNVFTGAIEVGQIRVAIQNMSANWGRNFMKLPSPAACPLPKFYSAHNVEVDF